MTTLGQVGIILGVRAGLLEADVSLGLVSGVCYAAAKAAARRHTS